MDGDVFSRGVRPVWKRVAEALGGRSEPEWCARLIETALAKELRTAGGMRVLGLPQHGDVVDVSQSEVADALHHRWQEQVAERVAPILVGRGIFESYEDVQAFLDRVDESARFDSLAGSLLKRPDGSGLRRPPLRRARTLELVHEPAPLGSRA